jgi:hypothetical protein
MPHTRAAEAVGLAMSVQPHVGVGMSDALGGLEQDENTSLARGIDGAKMIGAYGGTHSGRPEWARGD